MLVNEPAVEDAHELGLSLVDDEVTGHAVATRHIAVAIGRATAEIVAITRLLQLAASKALAQNGALILGDSALDLQQELVVGIIRDRVVEEHHLAAGPAELLEQQNLIGVLACQAVGAQDRDDADGTVAHRIAQSVEAGTVEP